MTFKEKGQIYVNKVSVMLIVFLTAQKKRTKTFFMVFGFKY